MSFIETVKAKAKANPKTVVLPESYDERMLFAAEQINKEGLAKLTILGNPDKVKADAAAKSVDLTGVTFLDPAVAPKLEFGGHGRIKDRHACKVDALGSRIRFHLIGVSEDGEFGKPLFVDLFRGKEHPFVITFR